MSRRRSRGSLPGGRVGGPSTSRGPFCTYCSRSLFIEPTHVRCAHPACNGARFCADCYSVGAALLPHEAKHPYVVVEQLDHPFLAPDWSAEDEMRLIDAIAAHGPDNWTAVGAALGRSARKCETHYHAVYLDHDKAPLPEGVWMLSSQRNGVSPSPSPSPCPSPMPMNGVAKKAPMRRRAGANETGDVEDFAEDFIADIEICEDDSEEIVFLKTRLLEMYNERLLLREAVKQYVLDNGPGSFSKAMANTKKSKRITREEKAFLSGLQVFEKVFTRMQMKYFERSAVRGLRIGKELDKLLCNHKAQGLFINQGASNTSGEDVVNMDDVANGKATFVDDRQDVQVGATVAPKRRGPGRPPKKSRKSGNLIPRLSVGNGQVEVQSIIPKNTNHGNFAYIILKSVNSLT